LFEETIARLGLIEEQHPAIAGVFSEKEREFVFSRNIWSDVIVFELVPLAFIRNTTA